MTALELELAVALRALETRLLALLDSRTAAMWAVLPSPPVGEIDAARGEVATPTDTLRQGSVVQAADNGPATYEDLGLSRQRVAEWRELRDAGEVARNDGSVNQWQGVRSPDTHPATYDELGLSRQRVAEWRELGEVATDGRPKTVQDADSFPATFEALGLSRQRVAEWRERGEVARPHVHVSDVQDADIRPATFEALGLSRQRVAEWRELRDAGEARP